MAVVSKALIDLMLLTVGAVIVLLILSPLIFSFYGAGYRCQMSVSLAHTGFSSNALNCPIKMVDVPQRIVDREESARFLAQEMLECRRVYQTDRNAPLRSPEWVNVRTALPRLLTGRLPEGYLNEKDLPPWTAINPFAKESARKQLCSVCAIVTFPKEAYLEDFRLELAADGHGSKTYDDLLYGRGTERHTFYFSRNSDQFIPVANDPATAVVFYTERSEKGTQNRMTGIVAMNHTDFYQMIDSSDYHTNLCQVYLS